MKKLIKYAIMALKKWLVKDPLCSQVNESILSSDNISQS